jgi:hypothetical protein
MQSSDGRGGRPGGAGWASTSWAGFAQGSLFGKGLAAGVEIIMLGIMLDRDGQRTPPNAPQGGNMSRNGAAMAAATHDPGGITSRSIAVQ